MHLKALVYPNQTSSASKVQILQSFLRFRTREKADRTLSSTSPPPGSHLPISHPSWWRTTLTWPAQTQFHSRRMPGGWSTLHSQLHWMGRVICDSDTCNPCVRIHTHTHTHVPAGTCTNISLPLSHTSQIQDKLFFVWFHCSFYQSFHLSVCKYSVF